jgi:hypothetical protein
MTTALTVEELTRDIDARRAHLETLLQELQRRGRKLSRPLAIGLVGLATAALGGYVFWRLRRRPPAWARN